MILSGAKVRFFLTLLAVFGILSFIYNAPVALADFSAADLELKTGTLTASSTINVMVLGADGTLYIGGSFTSVNSTTRNRLAAIGTDGTLASWNPNANGIVWSLAVSGTTVYAGGDFTSMSGNTNIIRFAQFIIPQRATSNNPLANNQLVETFLPAAITLPVNPNLVSVTSTATSIAVTSTSATSTAATSTAATSTSSTALPVFPSHPTTAQIQTAISEIAQQVSRIQNDLHSPDALILIAQIAQQVAQIQQAIGVPSAAPPPVGAVPKAGSYQKLLFLKQRNDNVRALQIFLKSQGADIYPEGLVTGYFGPLTEEAVGKIQLKYGLVQDKDDPLYGYLGLKTRAKINSLLGL